MNQKLNDIEHKSEEISNEAKKMTDIAMSILEKKNEESRRKDKINLIKEIVLILALVITDLAWLYYNANYGILETSTEQDGVYNMIDSEGNVISSDLSLEEMEELVELNGENQTQN